MTMAGKSLHPCFTLNPAGYTAACRSLGMFSSQSCSLKQPFVTAPVNSPWAKGPPKGLNTFNCLWIHPEALEGISLACYFLFIITCSFSMKHKDGSWKPKITGDTSSYSLNPVPTHTVNIKVKALYPTINGLEPLSPLSFSMLRLFWKEYNN